MGKKNLTNQANNSANRIASQDLAAEMAELSDKELKPVVGGPEEQSQGALLKQFTELQSKELRGGNIQGLYALLKKYPYLPSKAL